MAIMLLIFILCFPFIPPTCLNVQNYSLYSSFIKPPPPPSSKHTQKIFLDVVKHTLRCDTQKKQSGWLTSVSGIVKTYIKARLNIDQSNKESEKAKSLATVSPIRVNTNQFAVSQSPILTSVAASKVTNSLISSSYDRHRSPDPPPRTQRGNQSPLILRKKLEAAGSPLMQRR